MMEPVLVGWGRELAPKVVFVKADAEAPGNRALAAASRVRCTIFFSVSFTNMIQPALCVVFVKANAEAPGNPALAAASHVRCIL